MRYTNQSIVLHVRQLTSRVGRKPIPRGLVIEYVRQWLAKTRDPCRCPYLRADKLASSDEYERESEREKARKGACGGHSSCGGRRGARAAERRLLLLPEAEHRAAALTQIRAERGISREKVSEVAPIIYSVAKGPPPEQRRTAAAPHAGDFRVTPPRLKAYRL